MTYVAIPAILGPAIGPLVGGFLTTYVSWRWIFYINVPFGALGLLLALRYFDNFRGEGTARFDFLGFILCGIGLAALELAIENAGRHFISIAAEASITALAVLSLGAYGFYAKRRPNPAVDLTVFRIRTFRIGVIGGSVCRIGLGSTSFLLPLLLQLSLGYSAFHSGLVTSLLAIGSLAMRTVSPPLLRYFGFRRALLLNGAILCLAMAWLALISDRTPLWALVGGLLLLGFFRSLQFTAMNTLGYADLLGADISPGSSVSSVAQQLSASFGIAISATILALVSGPAALPGENEFPLVFAIMALFPVISLCWFAALKPGDGRHVSG